MVKTALDDFNMPPCAKLLGWRLLDARPEEGWIKLGFEGKPEFCNPAGFIQGGLLSAMLDDTMGPAVLVMSEGRLYTTTVSMTVNFLAPAKPGSIVAEAKVTQLGKTIAFVEGKLVAEDGTLLATATASERLLDAARVVR
ncbi:PaaI family thioesterase [Bradyrhizobium iriomotense]|uniref:Phenylacetic acid degradation protein n=1 Tax=Bradyrhizobium iriomotense TaxID=441950 RepID=A0ABQ6BD05_9BRAD|nr:PaaI family thioesterase [Bradyrhizobium iriomotense]GLR92277.1 phenylacetic acid degradation protein [Bradyrhizobium iriomotense]